MSKPLNILYILTDQMRSDALSIVGNPCVDTPNLDDVGRQGTVFTNAYSSVPSCIACRCSLFTGLSPAQHGRLGYRDCVPWEYPDMLPEVLGRGGYQTHCVGKTHFFPQRVHLGFQSLESYENQQNFDGKYVNDYHEWLRERTGGYGDELDHALDSNSWCCRPSHLPEELHNNSWVATRGIDFLRRRDRTRPFFLNLSFHRPHPPIDPPQVLWDMYKDREMPPVPLGDWSDRHAVPITGKANWQAKLPAHQLEAARRAYFAQVAHIDMQIQRVIVELQKTGEPYAVVFTSDHGEMLGDHNLFRKCYAYEGSAGVPLIISVPGIEPRGLCAAPNISQDIYSTILDIAGLPIPEHVDGRSLLPVMRGDVDSARDYIHGEHSACYSLESCMQYMTDGKEKYIWFPVTGEEQFFDMQADPQELRNLAKDGNAETRIAVWRQRLIDALATRPQDELSDGKQLIAGKSPPPYREPAI